MSDQKPQPTNGAGWLLFFESGGCNDGDHVTVFQEFPTRGEALAMRDQLVDENGSTANWRIVFGRAELVGAVKEGPVG